VPVLGNGNIEGHQNLLSSSLSKAKGALMSPRSVRRRTVFTALAGLFTVALLMSPGSALAAVGPSVTGDNVYVTNGALDQGKPYPNIGRFNVNASGSVTPAGTAPTGFDAHGIVFTPKPDSAGRRYAYVSGAEGDKGGSIDRYLVAANGALTRIGVTDTPVPFGIAISPDGRTVYVASFEDCGPTGTDPCDQEGAVSAFRVGAGGVLTLLSKTDTGALNGKGVAVTPDGRFLYVSHGAPPDPAPGSIVGFAIAADGSVVSGSVARAEVGATGHRVVITPDGGFAYVTGQDDAAGAPDVFGFRIGADGGLTPVPGKAVDAGTLIEGAAISPDGTRLYVTALGVAGPDEYPEQDGQIRI